MISIKKVTSHSDYVNFVNFPNKLYKNSKYWVSPIISEELEMMDKKKNPVFKNADADYYLAIKKNKICLLYTSPSPRDGLLSRMPSSA